MDVSDTRTQSLSLPLLFIGRKFAASKKNRIIFFPNDVLLLFCWCWRGICKSRYFFMQNIGRKSHQSCYYVSHNGLNHEPKFCWFITVCLLLCIYICCFTIFRECMKRIYFNSIKHIFSFHHVFLFGGYNSALIIQHLHNYNTIISWWKLFHSINIFTE